MPFHGGLVREQVIERAIEPILVDLLFAECSRSQSAVRRYQSSAMCSSLDGSHSRAVTSTAAIFAQATRSWPTGSSRRHNSSSPTPRHKASAK